MTRKNEQVAQLLDNIARLLTLKHDDPYRIAAYTDAARNVASIADDIEVLHRRGQLEEIRGVGPSIAEKIVELLETGHSSYEQELEREIAPEAPELLEIPEHRPGQSATDPGAPWNQHRLRAGVGRPPAPAAGAARASARRSRAGLPTRRPMPSGRPGARRRCRRRSRASLRGPRLTSPSGALAHHRRRIRPGRTPRGPRGSPPDPPP